jgi:hypothetical protein
LPQGFSIVKKYVVPLPTAGAPQTGLTVLPSQYPKVKRDEAVVENLHGVTIADPYRWLEDPDSAETQACEWNSLTVPPAAPHHGFGNIQVLQRHVVWLVRSIHVGQPCFHALPRLDLKDFQHPAVVEAQNTLTGKVLAQCETRSNFKELFTQVIRDVCSCQVL